jgi:hypothetical protein
MTTGSKKVFLGGIPDLLAEHGETKPSQSFVYKLSSLGELPDPCDYFGNRPRFDADEILACWRARVRGLTEERLERVRQSRQFRKERADRLQRQVLAARGTAA